MKKTIEEIAKEDGQYDINALKFIHDGLGDTIRRIREIDEDPSEPHHISGQDLARGLAQLATRRWGLLAKIVLNHWGVMTTRDMGEIVYLMIHHGWMTAQDEDRIEDFDDVYDFEQVFEKNFKFKVK